MPAAMGLEQVAGAWLGFALGQQARFLAAQKCCGVLGKSRHGVLGQLRGGVFQCAEESLARLMVQQWGARCCQQCGVDALQHFPGHGRARGAGMESFPDLAAKGDQPILAIALQRCFLGHETPHDEPLRGVLRASQRVEALAARQLDFAVGQINAAVLRGSGARGKGHLGHVPHGISIALP